MKRLLVLPALLAIGLFGSSLAGAQTLGNCATSTPCVNGTGPYNTNTGDLWADAIGKFNANFLAMPAEFFTTKITTASHGGTGVATITGVLKGNGTSPISAALAADIYALWSGTCSSTTFLRGDGACAALVSADIPTLNQSTTGNAATATALAATPTQCTGSQFSTGVTAGGNANCGTPPAGTVTSASVVSANGLSGTVATSTTTPAITLAPTFTGISYSNGSGFAAATAGNFPTLNQSTTGNAATATSATTATNIAGGAASEIPYQTGAGATSFLTLGSNLSLSGSTLNASGGGTPGGSSFSLQYNNAGSFAGLLPGSTGVYCLDWPSLTGAPTLSASCPSSGGSTVFQANGSALTSDTTVNFENSAATNGLTLTFTNPSAGNVQLGLTGTLANAGLANSSVTLGSTNVALGATATTLAGLTSVTSTGFTGALTGHASLDLPLTGGTLTGGLTGTTIGGTTVSASTQFSGAGTGLTGTASSLSIGGNAATATSATTATNVTATSNSSLTTLSALSLPSTQVTGLGTFATQSYATPPAIGGTTPAAGSFSSLTDTGITGSTQCLHVSTAGLVSGTGSDCGSGGSTAFSGLTSGTNTAMAAVVGTGASLSTSGTGTITATNTIDVNGAAVPTSATVLGSNGSQQLVPATTTGSGLTVVLATSPTLVTPALGTPSSVTLTNATGLPISTGVAGLGTGVATFLATPSSANLATAVTGETGTGALVFGTSPTLVTPALGTPSSGVATNLTGTATALNIGGTAANLSGTPALPNGTTATTQTTGDSTTKIATDAFVIANAASAGVASVAAGGGIAVTGTGAGPYTGAVTVSASAPNRTVTASPTVASTDMGGQINSNVSGGGTLTIPAISSSVFPANSTLTVVNYSASTEAVSTTPTVNAGGGCVSGTGIPAAATWNITSNGTTLDCNQTVSAGGGSGTVASSTTGQIPVYTAATTVTGSANATLTAGALTLGVSGTAGSVKLGNATSGTVTIQPVTGALGSAVFSVPTGTLTAATLTGTETLTNKTLTAPTMTAPVLGTPASGTATNLTGLPIATGVSGLATGIAAQLAANTTFTIAPTGCTPSAHAGGAFGGTITLATGPCTSIVVTMNGATGYTAAHGYDCSVDDQTTQAAGTWIPKWGQSAQSTTTATIPIPAAAGATDVISFSCAAN